MIESCDGRGAMESKMRNSFVQQPHYSQEEHHITHNLLLTELTKTDLTPRMKQLLSDHIVFLPTETALRDAPGGGYAAIGLMPKVGKNQRGDVEKGMVMYYGHCESYLELLVVVCVRYVLGHFGGEGSRVGEAGRGGEEEGDHMENLSIQAASADLLISVIMGVMSSEEASRCAASLHGPILSHLLAVCTKGEEEVEKEEGGGANQDWYLGGERGEKKVKGGGKQQEQQHQAHLINILRSIVYVDCWAAQERLRESNKPTGEQKGATQYWERVRGGGRGGEAEEKPPSLFCEIGVGSESKKRRKSGGLKQKTSLSPNGSTTPRTPRSTSTTPLSTTPTPPTSKIPPKCTVFPAINPSLCSHPLFFEVIEKGVSHAVTLQSNLYFSWLQFIIDILPYLGPQLPHFVTTAFTTLCQLLKNELVVLPTDPSFSSLRLHRITRTVQVEFFVVVVVVVVVIVVLFFPLNPTSFPPSDPPPNCLLLF